MTQLVEEISIENWANIERQRGRTEFTIAEMRKESAFFQPNGKPLSQRTVYDIARTYTQILGVEVRTRKRRNFTEQVFTSEQVVDIFCGISRKLNSTYSYAEVFAEMRRHKVVGAFSFLFPLRKVVRVTRPRCWPSCGRFVLRLSVFEVQGQVSWRDCVRRSRHCAQRSSNFGVRR